MRNALVTGAAGGLGAAISARLAADGLRVFGTDLDANDEIFGMDVGAPESVSAGFDMAESRLGPIAVLVGCAGIMPAGKERPRLSQTSLDDWERCMRVNATGSFLCLREFLRRREEQPVPNARAVLIGSAAAQLGGYRGSAAYVASKSALHGLVKLAAREAAPLGITVNLVAAGPVRSPMFDAAMTSESEAALCEHIPLARIGTPEDVAGAVAYLVSDMGDWVTGATLDVNGGYRMQ